MCPILSYQNIATLTPVYNLDITLCGEKVIHCDSETDLGVSLNSNITDRAITQTVCSFYQKITMSLQIIQC